jgi:hypothetical protein
MIDLKFLESMSKIRKRSPDKLRAKSLVKAAEKTMAAVLKIQLSEATSTIIFRETYEAIRQLGDARWWMKGYEPKDHEVSMEILKEENIGHSAKLAKVDRFRSIRNNANYLGYDLPKAVAQEVLDFWKECGAEILANLKKELGA